jgi:N-acetylmuramoyl-L-alanine amidase
VILSPLAHNLVQAPNYELRRNGRAVDMLILHYTGMASAAAACDQLCNPNSGVSCHYLIDGQGLITQMVDEEKRAWHAGVSMWKGETDTNSRSIGIEIDNPGHTLGYTDFLPAQMKSVVALCRDILSRHAIPPCHVLAHSDVAPGRKIDPGEKFDWQMLHEAGVGHWVKPTEAEAELLSSEEISQLQQLLFDYGYGIAVTGVEDAQTCRVLDAFRRHFRQSAISGPADRATFMTLQRLVKSLTR